MKKVPFIDCQNLPFSARLAENRMDQAQRVLGPGILQRFLCYSLYLFGVNRNTIGHALGIPPETAKSTIKTINRDGLMALEDRRQRSSVFSPQVPSKPQPVTLRKEGSQIIVDFGIGDYSHFSFQLRFYTLLFLGGGFFLFSLTPTFFGSL